MDRYCYFCDKVVHPTLRSVAVVTGDSGNDSDPACLFLPIAVCVVLGGYSTQGRLLSG